MSHTRLKLTRVEPDANHQRLVFIFLCCIMAIVNFDSGAIPAALDNIASDFKLNSLELGALGCLPYVALTVMSPLSGFYLTKYSPKTLIGIGLVMNLFGNLAMAVARASWVLCFSRFLVGLTQASFLIYAPVWVEEFAPSNWKTCWVALLQASVPIGIDVGYIVSGLLTCHGLGWQNAIWIQIIIMLPLVVIYYFIPAYYINVPDCATTGSRMWNPNEVKGLNSHSLCDSRRSGMSTTNTVIASGGTKLKGPRSARQLSMRTSIHPFTMPQIQKSRSHFSGLFNGLYLSTIFALCALFFVVNGMQYWCTIWLTKDFRGDMEEEAFKKIVIPSFGAVAATAPILGVLMGGLIIDRTGGYGPCPRQKKKALKILLLFAVLASICGIGASAVRGPGGFWGVVALLWFVLFFGGAIVPGETGVMLTSIPAKSRPLASGFGQGSYNIFGYSLGIFLPGGVMYYAYPPHEADGSHDPTADARRLGMQLLFCWSILGVVGLLSSMFFVKRSACNDLHDGFANFDEDDDSIPSELGPPPSPSKFDSPMDDRGNERVVSEVEMH